MKTIVYAALFSAPLVGCMDTKAPSPEARLSIAVAPLTLTGVSDACYSLAVFSGHDPATGALVWQRDHVCSSRYGDAQGALSYVGTCDASGDGAAAVRLVMTDLCENGPCPATAPGVNSLPPSDWVNPCPAPHGCVRTATCAENRDGPVRFDLTLARAAKQGFFDVAVEFDDIFCSAKLDCADERGPLQLLHDPADQVRKQTVVVAWACTAGPGSDTSLYQDNLVLRCYDEADRPLGEWAYDPSLGPGNTGPGTAPFVFQTAVYRTLTQAGIVSWSMAFGIHSAALPGRCVLSARATASDTAFAGQTTPAGAIYPVVEWDVTLSNAPSTLSCTQHALNAPDSGVRTTYTRGAPRTFTHALTAPSLTPKSLGRQTCTNTIRGLDDRVSFGAQPEGLTARVGDAQSPFYRLPAGYSLTGCCGDPCCGP